MREGRKTFFKAVCSRGFRNFGVINAILMLLLANGWPASFTIDEPHTAMEAVHFIALYQFVLMLGCMLFTFVVLRDETRTSRDASLGTSVQHQEAGQHVRVNELGNNL